MARLQLPESLQNITKTERQKEYARQYRLDNKEKLKEYAKKHYLANKERYKLNHYSWRDENLSLEKYRAYYLKRAHGISLARYCEILAEQEYRCRICYKPFNSPKATHIDHCHKTGKIRGILCQKCNNALGLLEDSKEILSSALRYLGNG